MRTASQGQCHGHACVGPAPKPRVARGQDAPSWCSGGSFSASKPGSFLASAEVFGSLRIQPINLQRAVQSSVAGELILIEAQRRAQRDPMYRRASPQHRKSRSSSRGPARPRSPHSHRSHSSRQIDPAPIPHALSNLPSIRSDCTTVQANCWTRPRATVKIGNRK